MRLARLKRAGTRVKKLGKTFWHGFTHPARGKIQEAANMFGFPTPRQLKKAGQYPPNPNLFKNWKYKDTPYGQVVNRKTLKAGLNVVFKRKKK